MAIDGATYTTGTATVAAGATAVTSTGTDWLTAGLKPGDQFSAGGLSVTIAAVVSNSSLTLVAGWPGPALNAAAYEVRFVDAASRALARTIELLDQLGNGNIGSLADLQTAADKLAYYDGAGSAALTDLSAFIRELLDDPDRATALATLGADDAANVIKGIFADARLPTTQTGKTFSSAVQVDAMLSVVRAAGNVELRILNDTGGFGLMVESGGRFRWSQYGPGAAFQEVCFVLDRNGGTKLYFDGVGKAETTAAGFNVNGALSKASGTFLIDHPLDPYNRDLVHGFVEAPRYELIYRGKVALVNGRAAVDIDAASNMTAGTFAALTTNAVVSNLQNQDGFARVRPGPVDGGSFDIICEDETCSDTIAWTVVAERNDPFVRTLDPNCNDQGRFMPERQKDSA